MNQKEKMRKMFRIKYSLKNILDNIYIDIICIGLLIWPMYVMIKRCEIIQNLSTATEASYFSVAAMLILSAYVTYKKYLFKTSEIIKVQKSGEYDHIWMLLVMYMIVTAAYALMIMVIFSNMHGFDYQVIWYIIKRVILSYLLPGYLAILLGGVIGSFKKKAALITGFVIILYLIGPSVYSIVRDMENISVIRGLSIFDITSNNIFWVSGFVLDITFAPMWIRILSLIALVAVFYAWRIDKKIWRFLTCGILLVCGIVGIVYYVLPHSNYMDESQRSYFAIIKHQQKETEVEDSKFVVEEYNLDLKFGRILKARCDMKVGESDKDFYTFTLNSFLRVDKVAADGKVVDYEQNGDYIKVCTGKASTISMSYSGPIIHYVCSGNYMYLPDGFTYYPVAGVKDTEALMDLYIESTTGGVFNDFESLYRVSMNYDKKLYTNLESKGDGCYEGKARSLFFMHGDTYERTIKGIRFVLTKYPTMPKYYTEEYLEKLADMLNALEAEYNCGLNKRTVYYLEYEGLFGTFENNCVTDDHIIIVGSRVDRIENKIREELENVRN